MEDATPPDESPAESRADAPPPGTPRWVKAFAAVAVALIVLFVVLVLTGRGGEHGPGRHADLGGDPGHRGPPAGVTHTQP